jgi:hypothetical protein
LGDSGTTGVGEVFVLCLLHCPLWFDHFLMLELMHAIS